MERGHVDSDTGGLVDVHGLYCLRSCSCLWSMLLLGSMFGSVVLL